MARPPPMFCELSLLETMLTDGRINAAITAIAPDDPHIVEIPLYDEPFWVALSRDHSLAAEGEIEISGIARDDLLMLADGRCLRDQILSFYADQLAGMSPVSTQYTSLPTILTLVGTGAGITLVLAMSLAGGWVTDTGIALRWERSGLAWRSVRLVFRRTFPKHAMIERLADCIAAILPDTVQPERR